VTLVLHLEMSRGKFCLEPLPDQLNALSRHGNTRLNGLTLTSRYTPAETYGS
jgi:hypothetical protein